MARHRRDKALAIIAKSLPAPRAVLQNATLFLDLHGDIMMSGDTGPGVYRYAVEAALARNSNVSHIHVDIRSRGGSILAANGIYNALREHGAFVSTNANDLCASAAMTILLAGDFRTAERGSRFLIHESEVDTRKCPGRWTAARHRALAASLTRTNTALIALYAQRTGKDPTMFARELETEDVMGAEKAHQFGFIHCFAGEESWINGRPYYFPDLPKNISAKGAFALQKPLLKTVRP